MVLELAHNSTLGPYVESVAQKKPLRFLLGRSMRYPGSQ